MESISVQNINIIPLREDSDPLDHEQSHVLQGQEGTQWSLFGLDQTIEGDILLNKIDTMSKINSCEMIFLTANYYLSFTVHWSQIWCLLWGTVLPCFFILNKYVHYER